MLQRTAEQYEKLAEGCVDAAADSGSDAHTGLMLAEAQIYATLALASATQQLADAAENGQLGTVVSR